MPTKERLETIQEFCRSFPDVKIIAMSGGLTGANFDPPPLALQFGAKHTLKKPFSPKELLEAITRTISSVH